MEKIRGKINNNYIAGNRFVQKHQFKIISLFWLYFLFLIIAFSADYAMSFSFFSKIHESEMGQLTNDKILTVALKAILPVAVAVVLKLIFVKLPKNVQNVFFGILLILTLITAINIGRLQMRPMMMEAENSIFPTEVQLPKELYALFGENELNGNNETQSDLKEGDGYNSKEEINIQKSKFRNEFQYYGYAFLMITAFGVLSWMKLSKIYTKMQKINQLKNTIIKPYNDLVKKEEKFNEMQERLKYLESNKSFIYRAFQDVFLQAYLGGLVVPKTNLGDLKIFGDSQGGSKKYPFFQVYLRRRIPWVNIDKLSEMIEKAEKSVDDLYFINDPKAFLTKTNLKTNELKVLSS